MNTAFIFCMYLLCVSTEEYELRCMDTLSTNGLQLSASSGLCHIKCEDQASVSISLASKTVFLMDQVTRVTVSDMDTPLLSSLSFSNNQAASAVIAISENAFRKLSALRHLSFHGVTFQNSSVRLRLPSSIQRLEIIDSYLTTLDFAEDPPKEIQISPRLILPTIPAFIQRLDPNVHIEIDGITFEEESVTIVTDNVYSKLMQTFERLRLSSSILFHANCNLGLQQQSHQRKHLVCLENSPSKHATFRHLDTINEPRISRPRGNTPLASTMVVVFIIAACLIGILLAVFVVRRLLRSEDISPTSSETASTELLRKNEKNSVPSVEDTTGLIELNQNDITLGKSMSPNNIWIAEMESRRIVVKRVEAEYNDPAATEALIQYSKQVAHLQHENIVSMIGVSWIAGTDYSIVTEYLEQGTLATVLADAEYRLNSSHKFSMCLDVAQALQYLHSADTEAYVRQLSSRTIFVNDANVCKMSLFHCVPCSSRVLLSTGTLENSFGTGDIPWSAPEIIMKTKNMDPRLANMYAFGVILGEIWTRTRPFKYMVDEIGSTLADCMLVNKMQLGETLAPHENAPALLKAPQELRDLIASCLSIDPSKRPSAENAVAKLRELKSQLC
ncbi:hypothetical protein ABG067_001008 [Albugo candida]